MCWGACELHCMQGLGEQGWLAGSMGGELVRGSWFVVSERDGLVGGL